MRTEFSLPKYDSPVFDNWMAVGIVLVCLVIYIVLVEVYLAEKKYIKQHAIGHSKWPAKIGLSIIALLNTVAITLVVLLAIWGYRSDLQEYETVVEGYHQGDYLIVEGEVENFSPMPELGHGSESFTVEGVEFSYTWYEERYAYHTPLVRGGVIQENGQYVRIGYVEFDGQTHIVSIETREEQ